MSKVKIAKTTKKKVAKKAKKKTKKKIVKKRGAPAKINETVVNVALKLYRKGHIDREVSEILGVSESTLNNWKKKYPEFLVSIKEAKGGADDAVEQALLERCLGYSVEAEELKVVALGDKLGSEVQRHKVIKHYPPDTRAIEFWLQNRRPQNWQLKQSLMLAGNVTMDNLTDEELDERIEMLKQELYEDDDE